MRVVLQKVSQAAVTSSAVGQASETAEIARGLCALVGFEKGDTEVDVQTMAQQLLRLRLYPETASAESGARTYAAGLADQGYDLLLVSQFTLSVTLKSGRPSFHRAMGGGEAKGLFERLVEACEEGLQGGGKVRSGLFGAYMQLHLVNEGPFTICMTCKDGKCTTW